LSQIQRNSPTTSTTPIDKQGQPDGDDESDHAGANGQLTVCN
jgi:hypothetical protein